MAKIRSFAISLAVMLVLSVCAFLTLDFNAVKATEEVTAPTNVFEMYEGGSIRFNTTDPGMRFKVQMSEDIKNRATAEGATLGFVISLTDYFTGFEDDYINVTPKLDVESLKVPAEMIYLDEDGFYYANAVVGSMLEKNLTYDYSCVAYLLENGEYTYATYSVEKNSRSWQEVASNSFFAQPEFRAQTDYTIFGTEDLPILIDSEGYNSYSALVDLVNGGTSCEGLVFELTQTVEVDKKLGTAFKGTLNMADGVNVYYAFTGEETATDVKMFTVRNSDYDVARNTNVDYVKEGDSSIRLYATPRWPEWYISQDFVDWLNYKEYDYVTFDYYIDQASANTTVGSGGLSSSSSVLINGFTCNSWQHKCYAVSSLTSNHCFYLNKGTEVSLSVYIDNVKFFNESDFSDEEEYNHLSTMFTVKNTSYKVSLNTNADFITEGDMSIVLTAQPQWPAYYYSQALVDYMTENEYTKVSFKVYVDQAGSATTLKSVQGGGGLKTTVDSWYTITKDVSSITVGTTCLQFNKAAAKDMNIYLDDLQFIK